MITGASLSRASFSGLAGHAGHSGRVAGASPAPVQSVAGNPADLTEEQQEQVARLKERDREVRTHEQAHAAAGGPYASAPSYQYQRGPDGRLYAVSGEVQIDASPIPGNPRATIAKMEVVIRAALAPKEPSAQDRRVAAEARAAKSEAHADLRREQQEEAQGTGDAGSAQGAAAAYDRTNGLSFTAGASALAVTA